MRFTKGVGVGVGEGGGVWAGVGVGVGLGDGGGGVGGVRPQPGSASNPATATVAIPKNLRITQSLHGRERLSSPPRKFLRDARRIRASFSIPHGLWLSLVERLNGVQEVVGSNPTSPILLRDKDLRRFLRSKKTGV